MPTNLPRVAYFPDSFHEVNGVAHTSRHFEAFARRKNLPFLCIRAGDRCENGQTAFHEDGNVWTLELPRGIFSFALEKDLRFDPAFPRHIPIIGEVLDRFRPDLIHITGPSEVGMLGAGLAHHRDLPLAASWHTNVHEYLARRSDWLLRLLPERHSVSTGKKIQDLTLAAAARFYSIAGVLFAPNIELCELLESATGRPCFLMPRGVDTNLFTPAKRPQATEDKPFTLGFVGRLSIEKNVNQLAVIHDELLAQGITNFQFLIIGHGDEEQGLRGRMSHAEFPGVLRGEALSEAYAGMDLFVFPSHTDTFGNVVLEALASGVPAIVTPDGGPRYIVREGETGYVVPDEGFTTAIVGLISDPAKLAAMRVAARAYALTASWDAVFEGVYTGYQQILPVSRELVAAAS
ncbi:MAG TPA: glycosyltransferase [Acidobacteriaceae bacterium]|jgi:glycosyltransferase involved in cell wall biosynthesis|nr:glycosyltransferase [Acidobacteriaceae bacterium]